MRNLLDRRPGGPGSGNAGKVLTIRVYFLAIVTSMGAFLFGYDMAFIGTSIELHSFKKSAGSKQTSLHGCW